MPAIFGITVPWTTGSTDREGSSTLTGDASTPAENVELPPQYASAEGTNTYDAEHTPANVPNAANIDCLEQKLTNDMTVTAQTPTRKASTESAKTATTVDRRRHLLEGSIPPITRSFLQPPRPPTRRSVSNSLVETRSRYRDPVNIRIVDESNTAARNEGTGEHTFIPRRFCSAETVDPASQRPRIYVDSYSSPNLRTTEASYQKPSQEKPLKTCLKQKANTATPTPTSEVKKELMEPTKDHKLRRTKTVDFHISKQLICVMPAAADTPVDQDVQSPTTSRRSSACPSTFSPTKSGPADPAVTRTDVHVIAISPSLSRALRNVQLSEDVDPATPTMQVVESGNGMYEVVWDDVPVDRTCRENICISSAGEALGAVGSTAVKGLERVNTKLKEWSGSWNGHSDSFKPTIVVYPDEDSHLNHFGYLMDDVDEEGGIITPPPNSERTSAMPSRHQSRPASRPLSRRTSEDEQITPVLTSQRRISTSPLYSGKSSPAGPDQDIWSDHLVAARGRLEDSVSARKLSKSNRDDTPFRGHQDPVDITRERLSKDMGISNVMYAHRDSIALAKKRMHSKGRAASGARQFHRFDTGLDLRADRGDAGHSECQAKRRMRCENWESGL